MVPEAAHAVPQPCSDAPRRWGSTPRVPSSCATIAEHLSPQQLAAAPHRFFCPISLDIMADPVLLSQTSQIYDYPSLITWFESGGRNCPLTGLPLSGKVTLRVDTELRKEILAWLRTQGLDGDALRSAVLRERHNTDEHGPNGGLAACRRGRHVRRIKSALKAVNNFLSSSTKFYGEIY